MKIPTSVLHRLAPLAISSRTELYSRNDGKNLNLKDVLAEKIPIQRELVKSFRKEHGSRKIGDVTVENVYGGMRGLRSLVCETSMIDPENGIRFRDYSVQECLDLLPKAQMQEGSQPIPEGMFWLLVTGDIPSEEQAYALSKEWASRADLPAFIVTMLNNFPSFMHPMSQLSAAITTLNSESKFVKAHTDGLHKRNYWDPIYEDAMDLIAKIPSVAAIIYQNMYKGKAGEEIPSIQADLDWSSNFCRMLGNDDPLFVEFVRLYMTISSDHEGGNVSAHTAHLVGSALSDPYLCFGAGLNGLAGPIHGSALREVSRFLSDLQNEIGINPSENEIKDYIRKVVTSGKVVHGCGHAVLRKTDPRFISQLEFAQKYFPNEPKLKLMADVYKTAPVVMSEMQKIKNPWPNIDASTGSLLEHFGVRDADFYTVFVAVSRSLGAMASLIWDRALELPIERPGSISTPGLMKLCNLSRK